MSCNQCMDGDSPLGPAVYFDKGLVVHWGFPRFTPDFLLNISHLVPGSTTSEIIASLRHLFLFFHPDATLHELTSTVEVIQPIRGQPTHKFHMAFN